MKTELTVSEFIYTIAKFTNNQCFIENDLFKAVQIYQKEIKGKVLLMRDLSQIVKRTYIKGENK